MATFLAIPMKKSYEVDMAGPIRTYISCTYSTTEMPTDFEAINEFNKLRNKATIQIMDRHENSLELLYRYVCTYIICLSVLWYIYYVIFRYYDQLCAVEGKLPFNMAQIPISFKWKDAFERGGLFGGKATLGNSTSQ